MTDAAPKRCPWPVHECIDDMCRHSTERGLCGKFVVDDNDWGEEHDDEDQDWEPFVGDEDDDR